MSFLLEHRPPGSAPPLLLSSMSISEVSPPLLESASVITGSWSAPVAFRLLLLSGDWDADLSIDKIFVRHQFMKGVLELKCRTLRRNLVRRQLRM